MLWRQSSKNRGEALYEKKSVTVTEMWECDRWGQQKPNKIVERHLREYFLHRRSLAAEQLIEGKEIGKLLGYVQSDFEVLENLRDTFANLPPLFKNNLVSNNKIGDHVKTCAEEERITSQPRNSWFQASFYKTAYWSRLFFCFILNWNLSVREKTPLP